MLIYNVGLQQSVDGLQQSWLYIPGGLQQSVPNGSTPLLGGLQQSVPRLLDNILYYFLLCQ